MVIEPCCSECYYRNLAHNVETPNQRHFYPEALNFIFTMTREVPRGYCQRATPLQIPQARTLNLNPKS